MESEVLVSVIIPTHKGSYNIAKAVDSVIEQTYKNIEIIVVDDNGRGEEEQIKTEKVLKPYIDENKIKYLIHEKNMNGAVARNTGIRASKGQAISFLDDDDNYTPQNIEKHIEVFKTLSDEYAGTYCGARRIRKGFKDNYLKAEKSGDILFDYMMHQVPIGTNSMLLKREVVDYVNGFDETFRRHQDWEFLTRILDKYKMVAVGYIGSERYITGRHTAKNPKDYEENRIHFLHKVEYVVKKLTSEQQTLFYDMHYTDVGKEYFKAGKLKESFKWAKKTSNAFKCVMKYFAMGLTYVKKCFKGRFVVVFGKKNNYEY